MDVRCTPSGLEVTIADVRCTPSGLEVTIASIRGGLGVTIASTILLGYAGRRMQRVANNYILKFYNSFVQKYPVRLAHYHHL